MKYVIVLSLLFVLACTVQKLPLPGQPQVAQAAKRFPDVTLAELNKGKLLVQQNCNRCHKYRKPEEFTDMEWLRIIPIMTSRAKLDHVSQTYILKYMIAFSKQPETKP